MDVFEKLTILADSAKYDVACTSSGADRSNNGGSKSIGNAAACGICHSFSADGRCISLLKVLMSNACVYDCAYCANRRSNDVPRATFTPRELAELTINFYKRNYIEGLFLSSGIIKNPNYTSEMFIKTLRIIRYEYNFNGYIHTKAIPGTDRELIEEIGTLTDRMSVNIELPSQQSLQLLAPDKSKESIIKPMGMITGGIAENRGDLVKYRHAPKFVPAGQSTQMIIGATPDTDYKIITLSEALYKNYQLKRVFYSAYTAVNSDRNLPAINTKPPLMREHRLYQADWLLRFYGFNAKEILDDQHQELSLSIDPKCNWAINNLQHFPVEINTASYDMLLRVPGIGVVGAKRIMLARRSCKLDFENLRKIGVVLKRARFFITCKGKMSEGIKLYQPNSLKSILSDNALAALPGQPKQLSLFDDRPDILTAGAARQMIGAGI